VLARLRAEDSVSWLPALDGWLVTRYDLALQVMRDPTRFTVDDARFSTGVVVGPSMLSLDGQAHERHRAPFTAPFRAPAVAERLGPVVGALAGQLIDRLAAADAADLRRGLAGPLAAGAMARALGLREDEVGDLLGWYDEIVAAVTAITAGEELPAPGREAFRALAERLEAVIDAGEEGSLLAAAARDGRGLARPEVISNAAVLLFGGIETTEGMIANAVLGLLERPDLHARVRAERELIDRALDESLRLEPAAAVIDRYATEDVSLAGAEISAGDLVRISLTAANRDPAVFSRPDVFDLNRPGPRRHLAFAQGPHVCLGVHLARLEARTVLGQLLDRFPRLRLDAARPAEVRGLVFRKPVELWVRWD
jgi:cytochrome P450